jgi:hypothetical protein
LASVGLKSIYQFHCVGFFDWRNSRVDHTDTTLETVVEGTLTTATGENLGLDDEVIVTWDVMFSRRVRREELR